jgi:hypothetical protein
MNRSTGIEIVNISPNPVTNENAVLKIDAGEKTPITISIVDITGRITGRQTAALIPGTSLVTLNTRSLAKGIYLVTIYSPGEIEKTIKLIKQ